MNLSTRQDPHGFSVHTLSFEEDEVVISSFGAQIISWTKGGAPIIFENREHAVVDGKTPYRGGAPICFPYFSVGTLLPLGTTLKPQHGEARTTVWESSVRDGFLVLTTRQSTEEGYGPTVFECELAFSLTDNLILEASIKNVGDREAPFQFVVHTYWSTDAPLDGVVTGLGSRYLDNLLGLTEHREDNSSVRHQPPVDRVYLDAENRQELTTPRYDLEITTRGCSGAVLWNPGTHHSIKDLGTPNFLCLESGLISPSKTLSAGEEHQINISYRVKLLG